MKPPERVKLIPPRLLDVQSVELLDYSPPSDLQAAVGLAVIRHGLGMWNPHVLAHAFEPGANKLILPVAAYDRWDVKDC